MKRYFVKNKEEKEIGPLYLSELGELYLRGYLSGEELVKTEDDKKYLAMTSYEEIKNLILKIIKKEITLKGLQEDTGRIIKHINKEKGYLKERKQRLELEELLNDFNITQERNFDEFNYKDSDNPFEDDGLKNPSKVSVIGEEKVVETKPIKEDPPHRPEKIPIEKKEQQKKHDKTLVNIEFKNRYPEIREKTIVEKEKKKEEKKEDNLMVKVSSHDETHLANVYEIIPKVREEISDFDKKIKERHGSNIKGKSKKKLGKKKTKKRSLMVSILLALIIYLLIDEKPKKSEFTPQFANITFPVAFEIADPQKALEELKVGDEQYNKGTFINKLEAAKRYRSSFEHKTRNNEGKGKLLLVYAELLPHVSNKERKKAAKVVFDLIKISRSSELQDIDVSIGKAKFYLYKKKYHLALKTLENFIRVNPKRLSAKFFGTYLNALINNGDLVKAKKIANKLMALESLDTDSYISVARYYQQISNDDLTIDFLKKGISEHKYSVAILLEMIRLYSLKENFDAIKTILKKIDARKYEYSSYYYAKFLEYSALVFAYQEEYSKASKFFKLALFLNENDELRSKLAELEIGGDRSTQKLIKRSKILEYIRKSNIDLKNNRFEEALVKAIKALSLNSSYIPSLLLLSKIHKQKGNYSQAISTLQKALKKNSKELSVMLEYIDVLIDAHKLSEAKKKIASLGNTRIKKTPEYDLIQARYYHKMKRYANARKYYRAGLRKDSLNDQILYELSGLFIETRLYKNARETITRALEIDPFNLDYHIVYSKIIYEMDGLDLALGYLRDIEKDFVKDPKLLANMAILYYRAGKIKEFNELEKVIFSGISIDKDYYKFLVRNAILNNRRSDVIKYSKELIKVDPGDIDNQMLLANYLFENERYQDCLDVLDGVRESLDSYPKLHYLRSKSYLGLGKIDKSIEEGKLEVKFNPELEWGYVILGEIYTRKKDYILARRNLEKALKRNLNSIDALMAMAWIKYRQNFVNEALEMYRRAKKQDPNNPLAHRQLGYIYKEKGQGALAYESFRVYLELLPNAKDAQKIRELMKLLK